MKLLSENVDYETFRRASVWTLLAANLLPLLGVLLFGWRTFDVVLLYWLENVVIGVVNVLKLAVLWPPGRPIASTLAKLFCIPFFVFHYGFFCVGHGLFLISLLGERGQLLADESSGQKLEGVFGELAHTLQDEVSAWQLVSIALLAMSHLVSFFTNFIGRGEFRRTGVKAQMFKPYGRIIVLHIAILVGGVIAMKLGSPVYVLVVMVVGKTLLDLALHLASHREGDVLAVTGTQPR
ncbi:hypothetical protein Mal64_13710 [Pseudobythopirellula maris]|uniref:Uncharacterized protein n=2 Tax=Pseudobythopirellula maris TaxID=2527991 RepID=A0A5C5ZTV4_9BACT|nr:hypothetical protein Mal64_13710 [Pseudobythopirellula maris]